MTSTLLAPAPSGLMGDPRQKSELPPFAPYNSLSTMAPSKADILQALTNFFGNPAQPEKLVNFSDHHAATYQLPDAFIGQSTLLRDTINNLLVSQPQNWQTSSALPFRRIDTMTVTWDKIGKAYHALPSHLAPAAMSLGSPGAPFRPSPQILTFASCSAFRYVRAILSPCTTVNPPLTVLPLLSHCLHCRGRLNV